MSVFTQITDEELQELLAQSYDLGDYFRMAGIQSGTQNTNYWLRTSQGEFVLTIFERGQDLETITNICDYTQHLKGKDFKIPHFIETKDNSYIASLKGKPVTITRFIHGYTLSTRNITPLHCERIGQGMATIHNASAQHEQHVISFYNKKNWPQILETIDSNIEKLPNDLKQHYLDLKIDFSTILKNWPQDENKITIHGDLFPDNALFIDDLLTGIIDFNFADYESPLYDLAILLISWSFDSDNDFDIERFSACLKSYNLHSNFLHLDKQIDLLAFYLQAATLRFSLSRFYDLIKKHVTKTKEALNPTPMIHRHNFMKKHGVQVLQRLENEISKQQTS